MITQEKINDRQPSSFSEPGPVISARQLSFAFHEGGIQRQVLFEIDLDIGPGEIVLLTGPSGSGKTTLLTLIGGLRTVQHGRLTVLNHDLHEATPQTLIRVRREIGFIFQMHNLLEFLTVRQNVEFAFDLHPQVSKADARCRSENILRTVGLGDHLDHLPSKLSTGQRQRVTIARALAPKPKLVLADEPTSALDRQAGRNVVQLLENLARDQDSSILMVTHDNRVLDLADRIVEMEDGRVSPQS